MDYASHGETMKSYEWDEKKAKANFKKHGITFGEATEVFDDSHALYIQEQEVYRIISARRLTAKERRNLGRF